MTVVGHWANLVEAQKLVQSVLLQGVIQEIIEEGQLLPMLPVTQLLGKSHIYNREKTLPTGQFVDIHEQIAWTADVDYTQIEVELKRVAVQRVVDKFMQQTYRNPNDYRAVLIGEARKGVMRTIEDKLIYGDKDNTSAKEFDGLHAIVSDTQDAQSSPADGDTNIDMGETALSLATLRLLLDNCKVNSGQMGKQNVAILVPHVLGRRFDAGYQEAGFVRSSVTVSLATLQINGVDIGGRIMTFDGIPIIRSDYLVAEQLNTGLTTATARAKRTSGTKGYSLLVVRLGQVSDGGLALLVGSPEGEAQGFSFIAHSTFDKLQDYDAGGERIVAYAALELGSTKSLGRIADITDAAIVP